MTTAREVILKAQRSYVPPPRLSISQWAEANITVSSGNNRGMHFNREFMPYLNEVMDTLTDPAIDKVVCRMAARSGKTFTVTTCLAYFVAHDPQQVLYMRPSDEDVQKYSKEELTSIIQTTPGILAKIDTAKQTYNFVPFTGGSLRLVGSNSPGKLAGYGVKVALLDEIDKYRPIPGFGTPEALAEERTAEYALFGRKIVYISTPTAKGEGVDALYEERSDHRVFLVPCPHCGAEQELLFGSVKFDHCRRSLDDIFYQCTSCQGRWNDSQRLAAMRQGRWLVENPERAGFAGFRLSRLYSPMASLESIVRDFLGKKDNWLTLRQFVNDCLGEAWDESKDLKASSNQLYLRREHYAHPVPRGVGFLTLACDVQGNPDSEKSWLEFEIAGWGRDGEKWVIEHDLLYGRLTDDAPWEELERRADTVFPTWAGTGMRVLRAGIDTQGGYTREVFEFLKGKGPRWIGLEGKKHARPGTPLITKRKNKKINSWEVGTETAKDTIFATLAITPRPDGAPTPGCTHFPDSLDGEYFESLLSEQKIEKLVAGVKVKKYLQIRARNEVLDLAVYGWYLYHHVKRSRPGLLEAQLAELEAAAVGPREPPPATPEPPLAAPEPPPAAPDPPPTPLPPAPAAPATPELSPRGRYLASLAAFKSSIRTR